MKELLEYRERFQDRHLGPSEAEAERMAHQMGLASVDALIDQTVPQSLRTTRPLDLPAPQDESQLLEGLKALVAQNRVLKSFIGCGYSDCITPPVIQRNVLENPGWYTAYTPYQPEVAQGRLEALLNFQTMISDLSGMEVANASLLDEATAAAEAMAMAFSLSGRDASRAFFISARCHPQTAAVVRTRAEPLGIRVA